MALHKAPDNSIHDDMDGLALHRLPDGCVKITAQEAMAILESTAPKPTTDQIRADRDARIASSDWTQLPDAPLTSVQKTTWRTYRQALRDVPEQAGFPSEIVWPVAPI